MENKHDDTLEGVEQENPYDEGIRQEIDEKIVEGANK